MTVAVVKPGWLTTLQDAGRAGLTHLGIGRAGAFDAPALRIANMLCGNPGEACGLEVTLLGPTLRLRADTWIAVTGAPVPLHVNQRAAPTWAPVFVPAGSTVALGAPSHGCRAYLAVRGGFAARPVLGSRSMDVNARLGPFDGRPLRAGDTLEVGPGPLGNGTPPRQRAEPGATPDPVPAWRLNPRPWFDDSGAPVLRLMLGAHFDALQEESQKVLFSQYFQVHSDSNRVGLRLTGPRLAWKQPVEMISEGCIPGLLQLPPSGQPIAFGPECPVSGGYPRVGQIAAVDIPRLAQLRPGDALRFVPYTFDAALAALRRREQALHKLQATIRNRLGLD